MGKLAPPYHPHRAAWLPLVAAAVSFCLAVLGGVTTPHAVLLAGCLAGLQLLALRGVRARFGATAAPIDSVAAEARRDLEARMLAIEMSHDRVRSVFESLVEGVLVVDDGGEVVLTNPAAAAVLRPDLRSCAQMPLEAVLSDSMREPATKAVAMLRTTTAGAGRPPFCRVAGVECRGRIYDVTAAPVRSLRSGSEFGTMLLLVDVTRTHEVSRLKDQFLSSISHELRTPLTNICAYAEILRLMLPGEDAEWPEFVRVIHEEGLHLSTLVDTVFDFLLLESGEAVFHEERITPSYVLNHVLAAEDARVQKADLQLQVVVALDTPDVIVDSRRWAQVCRSLFDNALKFTPAGGSVRVSMGRVGSRMELRVEDSGPGVPPDHRERVFEKFHQVPNHLTDKPSGTGLGLAACRAIVSRLGGTIWCEASPLGGAALVVQLPMAPPLPSVPAAEALAGAVAEST